MVEPVDLGEGRQPQAGDAVGLGPQPEEGSICSSLLDPRRAGRRWLPDAGLVAEDDRRQVRRGHVGDADLSSVEPSTPHCEGGRVRAGEGLWPQPIAGGSAP
jgi:hypothetical protein